MVIVDFIISTHTSLVGCDFTWPFNPLTTLSFLLTHPLWDVTQFFTRWWWLISFLLTHPLWDVTFKIHVVLFIHKFLLTHPLWDVTRWRWTKSADSCISTHTSLVGCDCLASFASYEVFHFYSHIPCGMWHNMNIFFFGIICISTHTSLVGCDCYI